ncbi:molybdopterin converting factor subunit 1 [Alteribacillus iranensis]|uniref:Molybdopterin synthase sulfur carrier subunit n=1 Tax=Alteribacillus iranensis TaxID=930128 RepID=A0A1I2B1R2_9BACI|nr:molybdopterin converting factor subunit 1 [Alteribacillus iranensis]SFE49848.1 molybdopterin synthase subunit MoaD [Alteribacillus iranensis]
MVKVLLFARLQEEAGTDSLTVPQSDMSVAELKQWLEKEYGLTSLSNTMTAINENYTDDSALLSEGDTVALIPPVSGG